MNGWSIYPWISLAMAWTVRQKYCLLGICQMDALNVETWATLQIVNIVIFWQDSVLPDEKIKRDLWQWKSRIRCRTHGIVKSETSISHQNKHLQTCSLPIPPCTFTQNTEVSEVWRVRNVLYAFSGGFLQKLSPLYLNAQRQRWQLIAIDRNGNVTSRSRAAKCWRR